MNTALLRLMAGFRKFKEKYFEENLENSVYIKLSSIGQTPKTLLIGCSDSRVDPAILTGAAPGELFVVRNVANLVPPCEPSGVGFHGTSSALEFAVTGLKVENIIILGHSQCGGINALLNGSPNQKESFIGQWMSIAKEAKITVLSKNPTADKDTLWRLAEKESLKVSLKNLLTFPFVQEAVASKQLNILCLYFDLEEGALWELDQSTNEFRQLEI